MGIVNIKIRNFKSAKKVDYDLSKGKVNCLIGKNGVGKTTIERAIVYFYEIANNPYELKDVADKMNPYIQKTSIELCFDFSSLYGKREHNVYIDNDIKEFESFIINQQLTIRFTQYKSGKVEWYPVNDRFKVVKILKIFPVYMVQTRNINDKTWSALWDIITDVAVTGIKESRDTVWNRLKENFEQIYGDKYVRALKVVEHALKNEKLSVNENNFKKRFKNALMTNIGGDSVMFDEHGIDFYSDGINSLKYMSLLINLLSELSNLSWKEVMIILDEPETSLHMQYIEELASIIVEAANKINFIVATHSTRLVSSFLRESTGKFDIISRQVFYKNGYTHIKTIQDIVSDKDKYLIRDNEAESYFANAILFVEGQTEVQLLKNRNIVNLFPKLKKLTIYNTKSDDSATKLILPTYNRPTIPFLVLLDMDKILNYNQKRTSFCLSKGNTSVNPLANQSIKESEKYYYYSSRKVNTYNIRKKIEQKIQKNFVVDIDKYYNQSSWFNNLIELTKKYCKAYRTIVFKTTVEGAIICPESIDVVYEWLKVYWGEQKSNDYITEIASFDKCAQVSITRLIFHGKTDYLFNWSKSSVPEVVKNIIEKYSNGNKVDGWIFLFFDWYFSKYVNEKKKNKIAEFSKVFPEIFEVVNYINHMVE